jgi:choline dehydrogenase-like flavoprotein
MIGSFTLLLRLVPPLSSENNVWVANKISGRKQGQGSPHSQRKDARRFQWHQLHDVNDGVQLAHSNRLTLPRYVRGSTQDYDNWAALAEDQGWSHAEMINYMRKHQTLEPIDKSITEVKRLFLLVNAHGLLEKLTARAAWHYALCRGVPRNQWASTD